MMISLGGNICRVSSYHNVMDENLCVNSIFMLSLTQCHYVRKNFHKHGASCDALGLCTLTQPTKFSIRTTIENFCCVSSVLLLTFALNARIIKLKLYEKNAKYW